MYQKIRNELDNDRILKEFFFFTNTINVSISIIRKGIIKNKPFIKESLKTKSNLSGKKLKNILAITGLVIPESVE
jgi:hypothetical protein